MSTELTLQEAALAWAQGKRVEAARHDTYDEWMEIDGVGKCEQGTLGQQVFGLPDIYRFRLAPEPPAKKWRPWEIHEVPVGALTRPKTDGGDALMIIGRLSTGVLIAGDRGAYPLHDLLRLREHSLDNGKTWLPCGVEVSE